LSVSARSTQGVLAAEVVLPAASARDQHCAVLTRRRAQPPPRADRNRTVWPLGALERLGELAWLAVAHPPADLGYRQVACRQQLRWRLCAPRIPTRAAMLPSTSDLPAYANGQRFVSKDGPERERFSDPDASWGHRSAPSPAEPAMRPQQTCLTLVRGGGPPAGPACRGHSPALDSWSHAHGWAGVARERRRLRSARSRRGRGAGTARTSSRPARGAATGPRGVCSRWALHAEPKGARSVPARGGVLTRRARGPGRRPCWRPMTCPSSSKKKVPAGEVARIPDVVEDLLDRTLNPHAGLEVHSAANVPSSISTPVR
jgi:hypothetical protein